MPILEVGGESSHPVPTAILEQNCFLIKKKNQNSKNPDFLIV